jgi:hypothetical protein
MFRPLTSYEQKLLYVLLEPDFPGKDQILQQIAHAQARTIDQDGSIEFAVDPNLKADGVLYAVPTEAEARDQDGVTIHVLLHVVNDKVKELEVFREDNSPVLQMPEPEAFQVFAIG